MESKRNRIGNLISEETCHDLVPGEMAERWEAKKKMKIIYQPESETIRQMPENYLLAHKTENRWICEPDLACNKKTAIKVFKLLLNHSVKYGSGDNLISYL